MNPALAISLSIWSAVLFGLFSVLARKAMTSASAYAGALISFLVGLPILLALSLAFSSWGELGLRAAAWFALGGALAPGLGRLLLFLGIHHVGVGRAMPLITVTPFLSALVAVAWLGERPGPAVWTATAAVVAGCALLAMKPEGDAGWRRIFLLYPFAHAVALALSASMRRYALEILPDPVIGATIATAVSLPVMAALLPLIPRGERLRLDRRGLAWFVVCGVVNAFGFLLFFSAFRYGEVSIVVPISYSAPLFALLFSRLLLREEEVITWQKWAGALLLFAGMALIVWRAA